MARSKRAPALYEVMRKSKAPSDWVPRKPEHEPEPEPEREPEAPAPRPAPVQAAVDVSPPAARPETPPIESDPGVPHSDGVKIFSIDGKVVRVGLTSTHAAIVVFTLALALVLAYLAGRQAGRKSGLQEGFVAGQTALSGPQEDAIDRVREQPPQEDLFKGIGDSPVFRTEDRPAGKSATPIEPPAKPASAPREPQSGSPPVESPKPPEPGPWVSGHTYVLVQEFQGAAREDALKAQKFLREKGIETELVTGWGSLPYQLVTVEGFNREDPKGESAAQAYLNRVRSVGRDYFKGGGRYKLEGYFKKYKGKGG